MADKQLAALAFGATPKLLYGVEGADGVEVSKKYSSIGWFNVKDYGAKGDSTNYLNGTDDRAAIQAACNAAMTQSFGGIARGGTVYFPAGLYHVSGPIVLQLGGFITLRGAETYATGIGGSFADYVLNDEMNQAGCSLGGVKHMQINNRYRNALTSCSYAAGSGNASASSASVTGNVLTVISGVTGTFGVGQIISGSGVIEGVIITSLGTGAGGTGTYNLSKTLTVLGGGTASGPMNALDAGIVTFGTMHAINGGPADVFNIPIGTQFHIFGMYPRKYNGRYLAIAGTTGSTLVGAGNCYEKSSSINPGAVTMLGSIGGCGIRMDYTAMNSIEKCKVGAFNGMHLGGASEQQAGGSYNTFGVTVKDTEISGGINGDYGSVGVFCGQACFINCGVAQFDMGLVVSSNGFGFYGGHLENNNIAIVLGRDDQLLPGWSCGAFNIISNHTEACGISLDIVSANEGLIASNQFTGTVAAPGTHSGINFTGTTTTSGTTVTGLPATVFTGNTTIRSPRITNLSSTANLYEGMKISGTGIPAGSTILTFDAADNMLTFTNAAGAGTPFPDPIGASATGSTVSITATANVGMSVFGANIPNGVAWVSAVSAVSGGTYSVTLNATTTGAGTSSYKFNFTPSYGMRLGGTGGGILLSGNTTASVWASVAGVGTASANLSMTFINHHGSNSGVISGLGVPWQVPLYPASANPAGIAYINCDNPSMAFPFYMLPGQPGQGISTPIEGMTYDITDCNTSTFLATAAGSGTGATAHRRVRYNAAAAVWQVIG